jgi:hypothetical protein
MNRTPCFSIAALALLASAQAYAQPVIRRVELIDQTGVAKHVAVHRASRDQLAFPSYGMPNTVRIVAATNEVPMLGVCARSPYEIGWCFFGAYSGEPNVRLSSGDYSAPVGGGDCWLEQYDYATRLATYVCTAYVPPYSRASLALIGGYTTDFHPGAVDVHAMRTPTSASSDLHVFFDAAVAAVGLRVFDMTGLETPGRTHVDPSAPNVVVWSPYANLSTDSVYMLAIDFAHDTTGRNLAGPISSWFSAEQYYPPNPCDELEYPPNPCVYDWVLAGP